MKKYQPPKKTIQTFGSNGPRVFWSFVMSTRLEPSPSRLMTRNQKYNGCLSQGDLKISTDALPRSNVTQHNYNIRVCKQGSSLTIFYGEDFPDLLFKVSRSLL